LGPSIRWGDGFLFGLLALFLLFAGPAAAEPLRVAHRASPGSLPLIEDGRPIPILIDGTPPPGVRRATEDLAEDFERVSGTRAPFVTAPAPALIIVGTLGSSPLIDRLAREGRLDTSGVTGTWEAFVQQVVEAPLPGVSRALVIAGADRRGTIYGLYGLSQTIGVSPWYWWADVPVQRRAALHLLSGRHADHPRVRHRGIFINDEDPALRGWAQHTFGGLNARFYERVYELILRSRGNFLWPAMWGKSLWEDDPAAARLANERGVVIGTSHHEPLMRAHVDWERHGEGPWDYTRNAERLRQFWREGLERSRGNEQLVTIGMRGDGDEPMTQGTATELLERIVADQRQIIEQVSGRPAAQTPQVWALYKEVQDYYDAGMRVPDDVTLLFADDNWGNIRRLPAPGATRAGGYGVYYHFDYVGGPRNYKWLNTNQIERTWEQMQTARAFGADRLWIVNVGDIKPMEYPISFFLDLAWNPEEWPLERLADYPRLWAERQFGAAEAPAIGRLLTRYAQLAARRKPELLDADTYSLVHHDEWGRVIGEWSALIGDAREARGRLPVEYRDAFFQLVEHPIMAMHNLHRLYHAVALNRLYAAQGRAATNRMADEATRFFARDAEIRRIYEEQIAGGRWRMMMAQTHIGYTSWQQPPADVMPAVRRIVPGSSPTLGVAVEGDGRAWPGTEGAPSLAFDRAGRQARLIELFNRGQGRVRVTASASAPWIRLGQAAIEVAEQERLAAHIDWARAPAGRAQGTITLRGNDGAGVTIAVETFNPPQRGDADAFVETDGAIAIEAEDHDTAVGDAGIEWRTIPNLGRTLSGVTLFPLTAPAQTPGGAAPHLDYPIHLFEGGDLTVELLLSPTLDYRGRGGLRYAVSIDDEPPQIVNVHQGVTDADWNRAVADNVWVRRTRHRVAAAGRHVVRIWAVDTGLVFQRLHVLRGTMRPSYLGPARSPRQFVPPDLAAATAR
jgi:hypothetical protein